MTMAAVAFIPLICASSASATPPSEAGVGDSPFGPVLKTCPSAEAAGVASPWAQARRGVMADAPATPAINAENRRRFRDLSTWSSLLLRHSDAHRSQIDVCFSASTYARVLLSRSAHPNSARRLTSTSHAA